MCNKRIYSVDLQTDATGIINVNVSQLAQDLINVPLLITVKQIIMQLDNTTAGNPDLSGNIGLRVCHNITTRNFGNMVGGSSNVLGFIDSYSVRTYATGILFGTTQPDLRLYAPYGLPSQLILTRTWNTNASSFDNVSTLYTDEPFFVRLEIERLDEE
jgi:hypothetical protein